MQDLDSTTTFDLFSSDSDNRSYTFVKGAETLSATSGEIITGLTEFADTETLDIDYLLMGPGDASSKTNTQAIAAKVLSICSGRKDCVGFISPYYGDVVGVTSSATQTQNVVDFYKTCKQHHSVCLTMVGNTSTTDLLTSIVTFLLTETLQDYVQA